MQMQFNYPSIPLLISNKIKHNHSYAIHVIKFGDHKDDNTEMMLLTDRIYALLH